LLSEAALNNNYWRRFRPVDIATLAYISIELFVILVFMAGKPGWLYMLLFYISAACVVFLMVSFPFDESSFSGRTIRVVYPMILFIFFYRALGAQIFIVFDKPFDWMVHQFESIIFGMDPAFAAQKYIDIWINEIMNFGYFSYYLLLPATILIYVFLKKWKSLEIMILSSAIAFYICYILFVFYPVTGPRFYLEDIYYLPIIGPFFTPLAKNVVEFGGHHGAAMPSSHCAIAFIVAWRIGKDIRKLMIPVVLIAVLLCLSTVYGRFHYLTDVIAGVIIGALSVWISSHWYGAFLKRKKNETDNNR